MSEKGYEPDIERRRFNVAEVPPADIAELVKGGRQVALSSQDHGNRPKLSARSRCREALPGPTAGLSQYQVEAAGYVAEQILADAPYGFDDTFDTLSAAVQNKVFQVMAEKPHLRGLDLVDKVEGRLTLEEAVEVGNWLRALPEEYKDWLRGE